MVRLPGTNISFTALSMFDMPMRADARRNVGLLLDAAAELLAVDPAIGLERVAAHAGVSRTTLYQHFPSRTALLDALTERSVREVLAAAESAHPADGPAVDAMRRLLGAIWPVVGRYRGLAAVNLRRFERRDLQQRLEPALEPMRALIARGQGTGEFDDELPPRWLLGILTDLIHTASAEVSAGTMSGATAERLLLRSASALLSAPGGSRRRSITGHGPPGH